MKHLQRLLICICLLAVPGTDGLLAQTQLVTRDVITGLDTPWELVWGPDNWIWITERYGRVSRINPETGQINALLIIPGVAEDTECGLLGMALHPNFADNPYVYVVYTYPSSSKLAIRIARYRYDGAVLVEPFVLLENVVLTSVIHAGSRMLITPDQKLLVTMGDGGDGMVAQSNTSFSGKILRMNLDGSAPTDNPWSGSAAPQNYFWTTGHRNPQGLAFGPNGIIYASEHGPSNDDELNIIVRGRNYGWPHVHGKCDLPAEQAFCTQANVMESIAEWTPTLAVAGIDYYGHYAIPEWKNSILMTTLKERDLRMLKLSSDGSRVDTQRVYYDNTYGRLRDVCVSPDGRVFIGVSNKDGGSALKPGDDRIVEIRNPQVPTFGEVTLGRDVYTAGDTATVIFTAGGTYPVDNVFIAQLSDSIGSFANPVEIGRVTSFGSNGTGRIPGKIPCDMVRSNRYRIRVITTNPVLGGTYPGQVAIGARAAIAITTVGKLTMCLGDSVVLSVPAGYKSYLWSNSATTNRVVVREPGTYNVRVTDIGNCVTVTGNVTVVVMFPPDDVGILAGSATTFCAGDSVMLTASPGYQSYLWSTGETGQSIVAKNAGRYDVTVHSAEGCRFLLMPVDVVVHPLPNPVAVYAGSTLDAGDDYASYQWHRDGAPIDGATTRVYVPIVTGSYQVAVTTAEGCGATSAPLSVTIQTISAPREHIAGGAVTLAPSPAHDILTVTITGSHAGVLDITVTDMNGETVMALADRKNGAVYSRNLSVKGLAAGAYIIRISDGRGLWTEKFVKE